MRKQIESKITKNIFFCDVCGSEIIGAHTLYSCSICYKDLCRKCREDSLVNPDYSGDYIDSCCHKCNEIYANDYQLKIVNLNVKISDIENEIELLLNDYKSKCKNEN